MACAILTFHCIGLLPRKSRGPTKAIVSRPEHKYRIKDRTKDHAALKDVGRKSRSHPHPYHEAFNP